MNQNASVAVHTDEDRSCPHREIGAAEISRTLWTWARLGGGAGILAVLVWRMGAGPFVDALGSISVAWLAVAVGITALTTLCCAWRWRLVAQGLGFDIPLRTAVPAYYRSQVLNATLPGGVLGDVHRAVRQGRDVGHLGRNLRAVAWERSLGQAVQIALTVLVLALVPSSVRSPVPAVAASLAAAGLAAALVMRAVSRVGPRAAARTVRAVSADLKDVLLVHRTWPAIALASVLATAGHTSVFVIAAWTSGADASADRLLPVALVVLLASSVPTSIAGWGPREGAAAWAFGAAGLGAAQGVTASATYGVMALVATLPGVVVLLAARRRRREEPEVPGPHPGNQTDITHG